MTEIPRRIQLDRFTPAERAIYDAVQAVEAMAADVRLTDAVILLQAARDSVADYIDNIWPSRRYVSAGEAIPVSPTPEQSPGCLDVVEMCAGVLSLSDARAAIRHLVGRVNAAETDLWNQPDAVSPTPETLRQWAEANTCSEVHEGTLCDVCQHLSVGCVRAWALASPVAVLSPKEEQ